MIAGGDVSRVAVRLTVTSAKAVLGTTSSSKCENVAGEEEKRICDDFVILEKRWWPSEDQWSGAAFDLARPETFRYVSANYVRFSETVEKLRKATFSAWDGDFTIAGSTVLQIMHMKYDACVRAGACEDPSKPVEATPPPPPAEPEKPASVQVELPAASTPKLSAKPAVKPPAKKAAPPKAVEKPAAPKAEAAPAAEKPAPEKIEPADEMPKIID